MNKEWEKVKLFHDKFGHPSSDRPAFIPKERAKDRAYGGNSRISGRS